MMIHFGYSAKRVNVKTDFLCEDLGEEIYMTFPQGMLNMGKDKCNILNKWI